MLNDNSILITDGTGSFGKAFSKKILINSLKLKNLLSNIFVKYTL
jgi:FlaA1/EpsC-like NDP-sugar epimerase|tara:strand:- start:312 stop:446 length:135 start_codon:yes stop_codon:yes gene_type:complete